MEWLEAYGSPLFEYRGSGTISKIDGDGDFEIEFDLAQLLDSRIFCELRSQEDILDEDIRDCSLHGFTEYGYEVRVERLTIFHTNWSASPSIYYLRAVASSDVSVHSPEAATTVGEFSTKFFITNFNFFSRMINSEGFHWSIEDRTLILEPLPNHKERARIIQASKVPGITASITVEPVRILEEATESEKWATRLCWLLSLAQGCYINWICHESMVGGRLLARLHSSTPLLSPTGRQLIPSDTDVFDRYIENCLPVYVEKEQEWQLFRLIDMFVRAMMSQPFPEPQGLHLAILMDYMGGLYLRAKGKERLIDEETFATAKKELKQGIKKVLEEVFPDTNSRTRGNMLRHIGMFQFRPFSDAIRGMAKEIGLKIDNEVVDSFVKERNSLAHRYDFSPDADPLKAVNEMISFVSKFILALLEYDGFFYDWVLPPGRDWENWKVRLELEREEQAQTDNEQQETKVR